MKVPLYLIALTIIILNRLSFELKDIFTILFSGYWKCLKDFYILCKMFNFITKTVITQNALHKGWRRTTSQSQNLLIQIPNIFVECAGWREGETYIAGNIPRRMVFYLLRHTHTHVWRTMITRSTPEISQTKEIIRWSTISEDVKRHYFFAFIRRDEDASKKKTHYH